jgi:ABC-2 type transport system ATP-binding protein
MTTLIARERLTKRYARDRGVFDLDLEVRTGEVVGFLGPNGAGKTTTIRTLLDLQRPTSGRAAIFGLDAHTASRLIRARTGVLLGEFAFDPRRTGRETVRLAAALRGTTDLGHAHDLAARFSADLDRPLRELSRGNRQKVGLLLALAHRPELLILDEPTTGLDPLVREEFVAVVREHRDAGATVLLSSHDLDEVQSVCDRVAAIRDGRLIATGRVDELRDRARRDVTVRLAHPADASVLGRLPGVRVLATDGPTAHLQLAGSPDSLLRHLALEHVIDLEVVRPSLDEVFLDLYRDERVSA